MSSNQGFAMLGYELWLQIGQFLGYKFTTTAFANVNKTFRRVFDNQRLMTTGVFGGHLTEEHGVHLCCIIDLLRMAMYGYHLVEIKDARARKILDSPDVMSSANMSLLRRNHLDVLQMLNTAVYTHWDRLGSMDMSVLEYLLKNANSDPNFPMKSYIDRDVQYWKTSRVFGDFYVICSREDGSLFVSADLDKVYLVLGQAQSIGELISGSLKCSNAFIGLRVTTTLLNWDGRIVYDGLLGSERKPITEKCKQNIIRAVTRAIDRNEVIVTLKLVAPQPVAAPKAVSANELELLKRDLSTELRVIRDAVCPSPELCWVFRRLGYSERENPDHLVTVLNTAGAVVHAYQKYSALSPTVTDVTKLLRKCVDTSRCKPAMIFVDEIAVIKTLTDLLSACHVTVIHYPPPSAEEKAQHDRTNPYLAGSYTLKCRYCQEKETASKELLQCSRCKKCSYCSKECQKQDWKRHKKECIA